MASEWKKRARGQALLILEEILQQGAYSNIALSKGLKNSLLSSKDKALVTEIVYGTITRKITLEWYLSHYVRDRDQLESWVYDLLLLSAYQLIYLDKLPKHAVVNEAVTIAKNRQGYGGASKLVNAILRQLLHQPLPDPQSIKRKTKRYATLYSVPVWLVKKMIDQFGENRAVSLLASLLERNKASIRISNPEQLTQFKTLFEAENSQLSPVGLVKASGHFAGTKAFEEGAITIQDESSQLVAPTLELKGDEYVLDACSAPGGKTTHIASYLTTGKVLALDLYEHKLSLVRENAERLHLADKIETRQLDASLVHTVFAPDTFDKILVDAPCSGFGLMRRKPDIKYQKLVGDLSSLQEIQLKILDSVCQTLKKGGIITYSTCTIFEEENQDVLRRFLADHPNFEQVTLSHEQTDIVCDGCLVITPEQYQTDGFFIGQLRRIS